MKNWHKCAAVALYAYLVVTTFMRVDAVQHSGSDTLINFALPFIALSLLLAFALRQNN